MPTEVLTEAEVIAQLTGQPGNIGNWFAVPELNGAPIVEIKGPKSVSFSVSGGIVLKAFINDTTAELRFYLAKSIDIPGRENL